MAITYIDAPRTTPETLSSNEHLVIDTGGRLETTSDAVTNTDTSYTDITVLGGVVSEDRAIVLNSADGTDSGRGEHRVVIGETGFVIADQPNAAGIRLQGDNNRFENNGQVYSRDDAVEFVAGNAYAEVYAANSGTISGNDTGLRFDFGGDAAQYGMATLSNSGLIQGQRSTGVYLEYGNATIRNDGTIQSDTTSGLYGYQGDLDVNNSGDILGEAALRVYSGNLDLVNSGTIRATTDAYAAISQIKLSGTSQRADITNTGLIDGGINTGSGDDTVRNPGTITRNVELNNGDDTFDGRGGAVTGTVFGGYGDDIYILDDATSPIEEFFGQGTDEVRTTVDFELGAHFENLTLLGAGDIDGTGTNYQNILIGNAGDNTLFGENSRDTIEGGAGADDIDGGVGNDVLFGGAQDDWVAGRAGNDYLDGGEADDFLFGGIGGDSMAGGEGDDTLKGGLGSDTMDGGAGADTFVFTRVGDSVSPVSDIIENFEVDADVLDFTGLVSGTLDVNILGGLSGGGQASLRTFENSYGDTVVFVDADGDGASDMRIEVEQVTGLTESDFLV